MLSIVEIREKVNQEKTASKRDKYRALLWKRQGKSVKRISELLGVCRKTIYRWLERYKTEGESGLSRHPGQGRKRTLTPDKVEKIKTWVTSEDGVWTLEKMRVRLEQAEGISVTQQAIWYRLKESKWSWKTGRPSNPEKDEKAQEAFREDGLCQLVDEGKRVLFTDSMRYGLISNPWRNWSPVGERVTVPKQMEFDWGYLWAEIDVLSGEFNVWLLPEMNGEALLPVVQQMPERWGADLGIVWDNSSVHKSVAKRLPGTVSHKFLPAYSPELNPVERFFEELRRRIANRIFSSISELEDALVEAMNEFLEDRSKVQQLCGYPWILQQLQPEKDVALIS